MKSAGRRLGPPTPVAGARSHRQACTTLATTVAPVSGRWLEGAHLSDDRAATERTLGGGLKKGGGAAGAVRAITMKRRVTIREGEG
jgi:hypothetical protein